MTAVENVSAGVKSLGNQSVTQKNTPKSKQVSGDGTNRATRSDEATATEMRTDTVDISTHRAEVSDSKQDIPGSEAEAVALLHDTKKQLRQAEQEQLEQMHNIKGENVVQILI